MKTQQITSLFLRIALTLWAVAWAMTSDVSTQAAFDPPEPSVVHDYIVSLKPNSLTVQSYLRVSPELASAVYRQIDTDSDGRTSEAERQAWFREHPSKLIITMDGTVTAPTLSPLPDIEQQDFFESIEEPIAITYTVHLSPPVSGKHRIQLIYGDNYLRYDEYYVSVAGDVSNADGSIGITKGKYPATYQIVYQMPEGGNPSNLPTGELAPRPWTACVTQPRDGPVSNASPAPTRTAPGQGFDILHTWRREVWVSLALLMLVLGVGAVYTHRRSRARRRIRSD